MSTSSRPLSVALAGFGTVGRSAARLLRDAGIATEQILAESGRAGARWAAVVRPCRQEDLDRALAPIVPAGGTDWTVISLPLLDAES